MTKHKIVHHTHTPHTTPHTHTCIFLSELQPRDPPVAPGNHCGAVQRATLYGGCGGVSTLLSQSQGPSESGTPLLQVGATP